MTHKKPTHPYGFISFSKDGSVRKKMFLLSERKEKQELSALIHFLGKRYPGDDFTNRIKQLNPPENDFEIILPDSSVVVVELIEIVRRDYMKKISVKDFQSGRHVHSSVMYERDDSIWIIEELSKADVIVRKIQQKNGHYQKPQKSMFWLLIWTVESEFIYSWHDHGASHVHQSVRRATEYLHELAQNLIFDEIWITELMSNPYQLWPSKR